MLWKSSSLDIVYIKYARHETSGHLLHKWDKWRENAGRAVQTIKHIIRDYSLWAYTGAPYDFLHPTPKSIDFIRSFDVY